MLDEQLGGKAALIAARWRTTRFCSFRSRFKAHILSDKIHILNVSFLVPEMHQEFGGCAANIAYSLKLLGRYGACPWRPRATILRPTGSSVLRRSSIRASWRSGRAGRLGSPACCELKDKSRFH